MKNYDAYVVSDFGKEWASFKQDRLSNIEWLKMANNYFSIFPWSKLPKNPIGADLGCGSGRWAKYVAPKVKHLICLDPSEVAIEVAKVNLIDYSNCTFICSTIDDMPIADISLDFAYSLGVIHHIPDSKSAVKRIVKSLKPGAPFLIYLYYNLDNQNKLIYLIWKASDMLRRLISKLPFRLKSIFTDLISFFVYWPLARFSKLLSYFGINTSKIPLNFYANLSFYTMRTDSLDRFSTRLEKRFSKEDIKKLLEDSGLEDISFSSKPPFWCAVGYKSQ